MSHFEFNSQENSDVTFVIQEERYFAHSPVLKKASYFKNLLDTFAAYNQQGMALEIEIRDYNPLVFYHILRFLYVDTIALHELSVELVLLLLDAAQFYGMTKLQNTIEDYVVNTVRDDKNCLDLWKYAVHIQARNLANRLAQWMSTNVRAGAETMLPELLNDVMSHQTENLSFWGDFDPFNTDSPLLASPPLFSVPSQTPPQQQLQPTTPGTTLTQTQQQPQTQTQAAPTGSANNSSTSLPQQVALQPHQQFSFLQSNGSASTLFANLQIQQPNTANGSQAQPPQASHSSEALLSFEQQQQLQLQLQQQQQSHPQAAQQQQQQYQVGLPSTSQNASQPLNAQTNAHSVPLGAQFATAVPAVTVHQPQSVQQITQQAPVARTASNGNHKNNSKAANNNTAAAQRTSSNSHVVRTPSKGSERMPLLQGPIWERALDKMNVIIEMLREVSDADIGTLFLYNQLTDELYSHVTYPEVVDIAIPSNVGIAGACFSTGRVINTPSAYTDPRFYSGVDRQTKSPTLALLAVPIPSSSGSKPQGVLELLNKKRKTSFSQDTERDAYLVARMIGKLIEKAAQDVRSELDKRLKRSSKNSNNGMPATPSSQFQVPSTPSSQFQIPSTPSMPSTPATQPSFQSTTTNTIAPPQTFQPQIQIPQQYPAQLYQVPNSFQSGLPSNSTTSSIQPQFAMPAPIALGSTPADNIMDEKAEEMARAAAKKRRRSTQHAPPVLHLKSGSVSQPEFFTHSQNQ